MTEKDIEIQELRRELAEKSKIIQEQGAYIAEKLAPEREAKLREYALPVYIVTLAELWTRVAG